MAGDRLHEDCVRDIALPKALTDYITEPYSNCIADLSRLNVFIGPNNCGKSRLLRSLFTAEPFHFSTGYAAEKNWREALRPLRSLRSLPRSDRNVILELQEKMQPLYRSTDAGNYGKHFDHLIKAQSGWAGEAFPQRLKDLGASNPTELDNAMHNMATVASRCQTAKVPPHPIRRLYIPTLRTLRYMDFDSRQANPLRRIAIRDYFKELGQLNPELAQRQPFHADAARLVTGCELYELVQARLLGTLEERESIKEFEDYLSRKFFSKPVALIPRLKSENDSSVLYIKIGQEPEQPVHHLGDGISQIILLTLPLYLFQKDHLLLFIEEPELYLHPGYQRLLIEAFLDDAHPRQQVFVSTHSQSFLDMTIDSDLRSVYKMSKQIVDQTGKVHRAAYLLNQSANDDFELLEVMGICNSSVLLSNCTIWVEGVTDRLYLRHFLALYESKMQADGQAAMPAFAEDIHYSFVEYSGSNITHWSFLDEGSGVDARRVCGRLLLIADQDDAEGAKAERHRQLQEALGDRFILLPRREIENLLPPSVLRAVVNEYEGESAVENEPDWDRYVDVPLGEFIETQMLTGPSKRKVTTGRPYAAMSGTIKDKASFCERACRHLTSWSQLSPDAQELTRRVIDFVQRMNAVHRE